MTKIRAVMFGSHFIDDSELQSLSDLLAILRRFRESEDKYYGKYSSIVPVFFGSPSRRDDIRNGTAGLPAELYEELGYRAIGGLAIFHSSTNIQALSSLEERLSDDFLSKEGLDAETLATVSKELKKKGIIIKLAENDVSFREYWDQKDLYERLEERLEVYSFFDTPLVLSGYTDFLLNAAVYPEHFSIKKAADFSHEYESFLWVVQAYVDSEELKRRNPEKEI